MPVMLVQLGRTAPTFVQGPRREVDVKMGMWSPVANTKYFLLAELYRIAGSRRTMSPVGADECQKGMGGSGIGRG